MRRATTPANDRDVEETNQAGPAEAQRPPRLPVPPGSKLVPSNDHLAGQIRESAGAAFLYGSMAGMFQEVDTGAFKTFRDQLLADAGNPSDPIEVMMIEQIVLAHKNIGRLQFKSASTDSLEAARVYGGLATQLLGEFRRTCLALQTLRISTRNATDVVVNQSATVEAGDDFDTAATAPAAATDPRGARLDSKEACSHVDGTIPFRAEEPEAGRGGPPESGSAARALA